MGNTIDKQIGQIKEQRTVAENTYAINRPHVSECSCPECERYDTEHNQRIREYDEQITKLEQAKEPAPEYRCIICGEETNGAPACWGCWDEALHQGLL